MVLRLEMVKLKELDSVRRLAWKLVEELEILEWESESELELVWWKAKAVGMDLDSETRKLIPESLRRNLTPRQLADFAKL